MKMRRLALVQLFPLLVLDHRPTSGAAVRKTIVHPKHGPSHRSFPNALLAISRPVALLPHLVDGRTVLTNDPLPSFCITDTANWAVSLATLLLVLKPCDDFIAANALRMFTTSTGHTGRKINFWHE